MNKLLPLLLLSLTALTVQAGQVYKWTDEKGRVHYGDKPSHNAERVKTNRPGTQAPQTSEDPQAAECASLRGKLETYRKAGRVVEQDSLGKDREYNEQERQQLITRTEQRANEVCKARPAAEAPPAAGDGSAPPEALQPEVREPAFPPPGKNDPR